MIMLEDGFQYSQNGLDFFEFFTIIENDFHYQERI